MDSQWHPTIVDNECLHSNDLPDPMLAQLCDGHNQRINGLGDQVLYSYNLLHYDSDDSNDAYALHEHLVDTLTLYPQDLKWQLPDLQAYALLLDGSTLSASNIC